MPDPDQKAAKKAKIKQLIQEYVSGRGIVDGVELESENNHPGHDYIFITLPNGKKIKISNNTVIGKKIIPEIGDELIYNGYQVPNTNIVHKVHPNKYSKGGWLELKKTAEAIYRIYYGQ